MYRIRIPFGRKEEDMIVEERLTTYLHSLESADIPVLDEIEQEALADMVPIIRKETKSF